MVQLYFDKASKLQQENAQMNTHGAPIYPPPPKRLFF